MFNSCYSKEARSASVNIKCYVKCISQVSYKAPSIALAEKKTPDLLLNMTSYICVLPKIFL